MQSYKIKLFFTPYLYGTDNSDSSQDYNFPCSGTIKDVAKYIDKTITYNSFMTVVRQICNFNKIIYKNEIKYDRSSYDINYYVYFNVIII